MRRIGRRSSGDLLRWIDRYATPVACADLDQARAFDVELLSWMDPLVDGKRFAFVGEPNHFVHEKNPFRLLMVRFLHSRGFHVLLEELAWSDGIRIDRYLSTGDESWLTRIGTFGYEGDRREDRDDRPIGYLAEGRDGYPTEAFTREHTAWLKAVRELGESSGRRLVHHGFDVDYLPDAGYVHLREQLELAPPDLANRLARLAHQQPGESLADEVARLDRLVDELADWLVVGAADGFGRTDVPAEASVRIARTARSLRDGFRYTSLVRDAAGLEDLRPGMEFREEVMHDQVDHIVDHAADSDRFVVFAHNLHLARDDAAIDRPAGAVGPGGDRTASIGSHIARRFPGQVFAIWALDHEGRDSQPFTSLGNGIRAGRGTLNALLARAGESFTVPTVAPRPDQAGQAGQDPPSPFARPVSLSMMYGHSVTLDVTTQADALYFKRAVSPLRRDPG